MAPTPFNGDLPIVSSGQMGFAAMMPRSMTLVFNNAGTFTFLDMISLKNVTVEVIDDPAFVIPDVAAVNAEAMGLIAKQRECIPWLYGNATEMVSMMAPFPNPQGTYSYPVLMGFTQCDMLAPVFFPKNITIHSGDELFFFHHPGARTPHNAAFNNGLPLIPLAAQEPLPPGAGSPFSDPGFPPIVIALNPLIVFPQV